MADAINRDHLGWLRQVASNRELTPFCTRLAVVLTGYFNRKTGSAFPSQETLAAALGATVDGIRKATIQLERGGHLIVIRRCGRHLPSLYAPALKPQTAVGPFEEETPDSRRAFEPAEVNGTPDSRLRNPRQPSEKPQTAVGTNPSINPSNNPLKGETRARRARTHALPDEWNPPEDAYDLGAEIGLTSAEIENETAAFRDHAKANDRRQADWTAAWRQWVRKAATWKAERKPNSPQGARHGFSGMDYALERIG